VKHTVDRQLSEPARTFSLRFACEDCAHFDAERARCVHGYVERPSANALEQPGGVIAFCKEFELGRREEL
jgi:hypothetical protein